MALIDTDYASLEIRILLEEIARSRARLKRIDQIISDYYASNDHNPSLPHHLEEEFYAEQHRLKEMEALIATVPAHLLPRSVSVSYPLIPVRDPNSKIKYEVCGDPVSKLGPNGDYLPYNPNSPTFDLELDKDGNLKMVDGLEHLKAVLYSSMGVPSDLLYPDTLRFVAGATRYLDVKDEDVFITTGIQPIAAP